MDPEAAARARRKTFVHDLTKATSDEEACPPEWTDISIEVRKALEQLKDRVGSEAARFATEPDVRAALDRRDRIRAEVSRKVAELNAKISRLNLIAPLPRFQLPQLDPQELLRPLYRTRRSTS